MLTQVGDRRIISGWNLEKIFTKDGRDVEVFEIRSLCWNLVRAMLNLPVQLPELFREVFNRTEC